MADNTGYSREAREFVGEHIRAHRMKGMPQEQAIAAAMAEARREGLMVPPHEEGSEYSEAAREFLGEHIPRHMEEGMPQDQAVAAAMDEARRKGLRVPDEE